EVVAVRVEAAPLLPWSLRALPGEIGSVSAPPCAAAPLRIGDLNRAALPPRHAAEEQRLAASHPAPAPATRRAGAASARKRVSPAPARSPQLDLQRELLGHLIHPRLPRSPCVTAPPRTSPRDGRRERARAAQVRSTGCPSSGWAR